MLSQMKWISAHVGGVGAKTEFSRKLKAKPAMAATKKGEPLSLDTDAFANINMKRQRHWTSI